MTFRGRPIWFELLIATIRTRGGLLAIYFLLYLAYSGLKKLTDSMYRATEIVRTRVDKKQLPQGEEVIWSRNKEGQKYHLMSKYDSVAMCGKRIVFTPKWTSTPPEAERCKTCVKRSSNSERPIHSI